MFSSIKSKGKWNFLQNHLGKGDFSGENLGLFFQSLLIKLLAEAIAMVWWKRKTTDYHQKLSVRVASRIVEQFGTNSLKT